MPDSLHTSLPTDSLTAMLDSSLEAVIIIDQEHSVVFFNKAAEMMFKCSAHEAIGQPIGRFVPDPHGQLHGKFIHDFGETYTSPRRMGLFGRAHGMRLDGSQFSIEASISQFTFQSKKYYAAIMRDVSSRAHDEEEMLKRNRMWQLLFQFVPTGVIAADARTRRFVYANPAACQLLGYSHEEMVKLSVDQVHPSQALLDIIAQFEEMVQGRRKLSTEIPCVRKDGSVVFVDIYVARVDENEGPILIGFFVDGTQRRRATRELQESESLYHSLFDATGTAMAIVEEDMMISLVNSAFVRLTRLDKESIQGTKEWQRFIHPDDVERLQEYHRMRRIDPMLAPSSYECRFVDALGNERDVMISAVLIPTTNKTLVSALDVTRYKEIEHALKHSEERYRLMVESNTEVIYQMTFENAPAVGRAVYVSGQLRNMLGYDSEQLMNDPEIWRDMVHPDDVATLLARTKQAVESRQPTTREFRLRHKVTGNYHWIEDTIVVLTNERDQVTGYQGSARDITERRQLEDRLQELSSALEQTADAVMITDHDGIIKYVNPAFEQLTGYSKEECIGRTPSIQKSDANDPGIYEVLWKTILSGRPYRNVIINRKKSGERYYAEKTITPLRDRRGAITHFISTDRDITERINIKLELVRSSEQLRSLSARLEQVLEDERTRLSHRVHDDIGQALTILTTDLYWLEKRLAPDQIKLQEKIHSMHDSIEDILKITQGIASELRPSILDDFGLDAAVEEEIREFQERSGIRASLSVALEGEPVEEEIGTVVFRILRELLTNVVRHSKAMQVDVSLHTSSGSLRLEVTDNGIGFDEMEIADTRSCLGLLGIRERLHPFNGVFTIRRAQGSGTVAAVSIPLRPVEREQ